mmetsp:Transcript_1226/g.1793  ORF Transcript_1226/g.1793 Transcript_1226/m.1793 type:complete len:895 (-) Transcript_1226:143-2827(-)
MAYRFSRTKVVLLSLYLLSKPFCHGFITTTTNPLATPPPQSALSTTRLYDHGALKYSGLRPHPPEGPPPLSTTSPKKEPPKLSKQEEDDEMEGFTMNNIMWSSGYTSQTQPYSRSLLSKSQKRKRQQHLKSLEQQRKDQRAKESYEDGYADMFPSLNKPQPFWKKTLRKAKNVLVKKKVSTPGTLILVRHGESTWNKNKTFTGWADPDLSDMGLREVEHAARLLLEGGYEIDVVFTSRLKRAIKSTLILLNELDQTYLPVFKSWRLNERMYGALTGLSKKETAEKLGHELVQAWRGSLKSRPPPLQPTDTYYPGRDRRYSDLTAEQLPLTESLLDCMDRTKPIWEDKISYELRQGRNVLVVAHANTLRGLVKIIDNIGDDEIQEVSIPTGIPVVYKFDKDLNTVQPKNIQQTQIHMNGLFLEKPGLLKDALKREEDWCSRVPEYNSTIFKENRPMSSLERSLYKLNATRELGEWAGQFVDAMGEEEEDDGSDGNMGRGIMMKEDAIWERGLHDLEEGIQFDPDYPEFHSAAPSSSTSSTTSITNTGFSSQLKLNDKRKDEERINPTMITNYPCLTPLPTSSVIPGMGYVPVRRDSVIVIIRHGKTEHNKLGLFTGWEDAPLAKDGIEEAREAGRLLKLHGFQFDVVYTSWLSRAIETAWYVMDEMNELWLPIIKSWRLNERMYGDLTSLSKQMVAQRHGEEQFKAWRRGYDVKPPAVSSFSKNYPGNDKRYTKYLNDLRYSVRETLIRSIEAGKFEKHRKLPKSESLKDCNDRTIPYFTEHIIPEAVNQGKRVLISSSENAIRGLLMHLCEIPEEEIVGLEIPNGLPLIFDVKSKCVKLLDDGTGRDPLDVYNFGKSANYLFRPCENEDGTFDEECDLTYVPDSLLDIPHSEFA